MDKVEFYRQVIKDVFTTQQGAPHGWEKAEEYDSQLNFFPFSTENIRLKKCADLYYLAYKHQNIPHFYVNRDYPRAHKN